MGEDVIIVKNEDGDTIGVVQGGESEQERIRALGFQDDERLAQMDASMKYELYRVLSTLELRHLAGRRGHDVIGFNRQQIIATLIEKED